MKFLRSLLGKRAEETAEPAVAAPAEPDPVLSALAELEIKRLREALQKATPAPAKEPEPEPEFDISSLARPQRVVKAKAPLPDGAKLPSVNIWDIEDDVPASRRAVAAPPATMGRSRPAADAGDRAARPRTRAIGFDSEASANVGAAVADIVSLFSEDQPAAPAKPAASQAGVMFPVGWLVVKAGPGQGNVFALTQGVSQIGRGSDQTVVLDFGDATISRQNHASVAYDPQSHQFHIGHGGKTNLVRLNGKPLLSTERVVDGDQIQIGETTLLLKTLCSPAFNWSQSEAGGDGHDMAIA